MILPENGSVVVIDDDHNQAKPILDALAKKGIATTYFKGTGEKEVPYKPLKNVRLVILDLQLNSMDNNGHIIASRLVNVLKNVISDNNGPFMVLIWSLKNNLFGEDFRNEINKRANARIPVCIATLEKAKCLERSGFKKAEELAESVVKELKPRFQESDLEAIRKNIIFNYHEEEIYESTPNAFEEIEASLKNAIEKAGVFHLFVLWENLLKNAAAKTVADVASAIELNEYWERNMRNLFYRLGKARVGQNEVRLSDSMLTFMQSYNDNAEKEIQLTTYPEYIKLESENKLFVNKNGSEYKLGVQQGGEAIFKDDSLLFFNGNDRKKLIKAINAHKEVAEKKVLLSLLQSYDEIPPRLNTGMHLELNPSEIHIPGNIYEIPMEEGKKQEYLSSTYYKSKRGNLSDFTFIELEISPICDYAQTKWKKSRLVSGLLYPSHQDVRSNVGHFYYVEPDFLLDGKVCKMVFDCHLFKALDHDVVKKRIIKYRLKRELLLDIVAKVSSHVNRPGISFVQ